MRCRRRRRRMGVLRTTARSGQVDVLVVAGAVGAAADPPSLDVLEADDVVEVVEVVDALVVEVDEPDVLDELLEPRESVL